MHIRHYLATLEFVNEERVALGLDPLDHLPAGTPGNSEDCAIARAVPGSLVGSGSITRHDRQRTKLLPAEVARFVQTFDREAHLAHVSDPGRLVKGGIEDDKGCLVPA